MSFAMFQGFARVGAALPTFLLRVGAKVSGAIADGTITVDEAEQLAAEASKEAGDLRVRVNEVDIVDDQAQSHLAAFVGRVTAKLVTALRK